MFLPQLQQENVKLNQKIEAEGTKSVSIEEVDESKGGYVEMVLFFSSLSAFILFFMLLQIFYYI